MKAPFEGKGRWYRLFIESTDEVAQITRGDEALIDSVVSSTTIHFPTGFRAVDIVTDVHNIGGNVTNYSAEKRLFADGSQGSTLPPLANYDYMYMYIFGYFD